MTPLETLKQVFSAVLGIDASKVTDGLSPATTPSWDSLNAIVLVSEIEKAFNVRFTYDEVMGVRTFADVINVVESKGVTLR